MTIEISAFIPFLTLGLAFAGLMFAIVKWRIDQKRIRQLVSVRVASILEGIAGQCLLVTYDEGSWDEDMKIDANFSSTPNNPTVSAASIPAFEDIRNVEHIGLVHLNRLLALAPIDGSIQSYLSHVAEHDGGSFDDYFHDRQILYAGFGEYVSRLAHDIRAEVNAPGIGTLSDETTVRIKAQLSELIVSSRRDSEDIKGTYERIFLPTSESYWPDVVKAKPSKLEHVTKTGSAKPKTT